MGNGAAVKTGARSATGDVLVFMEDALCAFYIPETLLLAVGILNTAGRYDISKGLLADARDREPPRHPIRALKWEQELERIESILQGLPEQSEGPRS
jgi:hypothetical protein